MSLLLIDAGNSRIKWTRCTVDRFDATSVASVSHADVDTLGSSWDTSDDEVVEAAWISNVAGAAMGAALERSIGGAFGQVPVHFLVPPAVQCGVVNRYRNPSQLGPDRWAAVLGAAAACPHGDVLVCGFGTATTIDLLSREREATFVGGLILPGTETMRRSLARDTARLPMAEGAVQEFADSTDDAIVSGIMAAQVGAVRLAAARARARIAAAARPLQCVLTGGGAQLIAGAMREAGLAVEVVPDLVLRGLHAIASTERTDYDTHPEPHKAAR